MSGYTQLTQEERYQIYILKKAEYSQAEIADLLERDKSTISRELRRNRGLKGYRPQQAHHLALLRRYDKAQPRIGDQVWQQVETLIREEWSPEQVVGRLEDEQGVSISHEWIYQYIYADKRSGGDLYRYLRCQKPRRKRYGSYDRRGIIPNQVSIDDRPAIVDSKRRIGDWEGDTVIGKGHRGALVTLVERKSLYTVIRSVLHKTAKAVRDAVVDGLTPYIDWVHTITYDNGREFADHEGMASELEARIYFAHPYASWERGLNENTNGLIRQYFPKDRDLTTVTEREIEKAMDKLNHRPRKSLGYRTPYEVFFNTRTSLTVALQS
ncbi:MAG: IS30 family transposase [Gammaproteobacteria bacterium]